MMQSVWPNSTGWASLTQISPITPPLGAAIGFIVFIASTMNNVSPSLTVWPTVMNGLAPGSGAKYTVPTIGEGTAPGFGPDGFAGAGGATGGAGAATTA